MLVFLVILGVIAVSVAAGLVVYLRRAPDPGFPAGQTALDFVMKDIKGREVDLRQYHGKVILIVNVASKCGFTPQYEQLNALYKKYRDRGFVVLGFPANNFLFQEPGTNEAIEGFCRLNFGVEFDMFSKISVRGSDIAPLYAFLTLPKYNPGFDGSIQWNFTKFVLDRQGKVIGRFGPSTRPDAAEIVAAIERALQE